VQYLAAGVGCTRRGTYIVYQSVEFHSSRVVSDIVAFTKRLAVHCTARWQTAVSNDLTGCLWKSPGHQQLVLLPCYYYCCSGFYPDTLCFTGNSRHWGICWGSGCCAFSRVQSRNPGQGHEGKPPPPEAESFLLHM